MAIRKELAGVLTNAETHSIDVVERHLDVWLDNRHTPQTAEHFVSISMLDSWAGDHNSRFTGKMLRELITRYTATDWTVELTKQGTQEGLKFS